MMLFKHFPILTVCLIFFWPAILVLSRPFKESADHLVQSSESSSQSICLLLTQGTKTNPSAERADTIIKKSLAAYGGETRVLSLKDATYEYRVESVPDSSSQPIVVKTYFKNEAYFRSEAHGDNLDAVTILNGDNGWVKVGDTTLTLSKKEIDPLKTGMIAQLRPDLLLLSFPKRRYMGRAQENGRTLELVEISGFIGGEYLRGRLSFDVNTTLLYKYEFETERDLPKGRGIVKGEERYLQYSEKEGLKYPTEVISKQGQKVSRLTMNEVNFSSVLNENLFQQPSPAATPAK